MGLSQADLFAHYPKGREPIALRRVRSTLICSGIAEFRARGLFDAYAAKLDPPARDVLVNAIAGVWLSADIAMKHFGAIDSLGLTPTEAFEIGASSSRRVQQSVLQTVVHLASGAGATPWTVLQVYERLWPRIMDGGAFTISRAGPKDAVIEYRMVPPCRFPYFRNAFRGVNHAALGLFTTTVYVNEMPKRSSADGMAFHCAWA
jgi:hypothetical protein